MTTRTWVKATNFSFEDKRRLENAARYKCYARVNRSISAPARRGDRDRRAEELAVMAALGVGNEAELLDQA